ncbi:tol-pal system protein YbgF, partial [Thioclava sp. BHET1]
RQETLADIQKDLSAVNAKVQGLKAELTPSGASSVQQPAGSTTQDRLDAIEAELQTLTQQTEMLQNRINQVVRDGTNRIGDLQFRLTELEGKDVSKLGKTPPLGTLKGGSDHADQQVPPVGNAANVGIGDAAGAQASDPAAAAQPNKDAALQGADGQQLAVGEQSDFDRAKAAYDAGNYQLAAGLFGTFAQTYTGGKLTGEALYYRGQALSNMHDTANAARAYLDSFSNYPKGARAADSLTQLGISLGKLGQVKDACTTLGQVSVRYPAAPAVEDAATAMQQLSCK